MKNIVEIATLLIGVAMVALLVNPRANTAQVISVAGSTFDQLLRTVSLQNSGGVGYGAGTFRQPY